MESLLNNVEQTIHSAPWLAVLAVFLGGVLSAASPCVLAMIPLTMSYVAGQQGRKPSALRGFTLSLVFVAGLSIAFTILGMTAALFGSMYGEVSGAWNWVVAAVCLIMGLHLAGVLNFTIPMPLKSQPKIRGMAGALIMGLLFGAASAPCAAPILVVLLTYLAGSGASVAYGALLLFVYALGHSVLILVAGTSMGVARTLIESRGFTRATDLLRRGAGLVIIGIGIFFIWRGLS